MSQPLLHDLLPPIARRWANRLLGKLITLRGPYADWETAKSASTGYDSEDILERVKSATLRVLSADGVYEQDGMVLRAKPPPSYALSAILLGAARNDGTLSVVDFGGGLASLYLRWREWLAPLPHAHWCVIEQPQFVAAGRQLFAGNPGVSFGESTEQARASKPNVVVASSVLQYVPEPFIVLGQLLSLGADVMVIDRTPYNRTGGAAIVTQHVPARIGTASYPQWIFARESIYAAMRQHYDLLMEFPTQDATLRCGPIVADYQGSAWLRRRGT